mgnify:CR=1 FL=1
MFEISSKNANLISFRCDDTALSVDLEEGVLDAGLKVGKISGPGEFEIGKITVRGIGVETKTIYGIEINGVHVGLVGAVEKNLDELGMIDVLFTSSVKAIKDLDPKLVVATGNVDGMVTELKLTARVEKKLKIKNADSLPTALEVVVLN